METYYTCRDRDDHNRILKIAAQVARGIESEVFVPNTGSWMCANCEYAKACETYLKS